MITAFAAVLRNQGHGRIVVLSSVAGVRVRRANYVYGASKAGLDAFAQGTAESLRGTGASLMIVRPGWVATRMTEGRDPAPLARAEALARPLGPYALQAAIAACHARAKVATDTEWKRIVALYDALAELTQSPVVELNRAVAVSMAFGPAAGLQLVDALVEEAALRSFHLLPSVRGDLLVKLGRGAEARGEFERAASMAGNARERALLLSRAKACDAKGRD